MHRESLMSKNTVKGFEEYFNTFLEDYLISLRSASVYYSSMLLLFSGFPQHHDLEGAYEDMASTGGTTFTGMAFEKGCWQ